MYISLYIYINMYIYIYKHIYIYTCIYIYIDRLFCQTIFFLNCWITQVQSFPGFGTALASLPPQQVWLMGGGMLFFYPLETWQLEFISLPRVMISECLWCFSSSKSYDFWVFMVFQNQLKASGPTLYEWSIKLHKDLKIYVACDYSMILICSKCNVANMQAMFRKKMGMMPACLHCQFAMILDESPGWIWAERSFTHDG